MSEDAINRAKEIAARFSNPLNVDANKRKRWGDDDQTIKRVKVYIPVDKFPDVNFLGILIGPKGQTQKELQEMSGAKILFRGKNSNKDKDNQSNLDDEDDDLHVLIEGTQESIDKAKEEVEKILYNPTEAMKIKSEQLKQLETSSSSTVTNLPGHSTLDMTVPNNQVGLIIGKGGENLARLQSQFGVTLQIAKEGDPRPITIKGPIESLEDAKKRIEEIVYTRNNNSAFSLQSNVPTSSNINLLSASSKDLNCKYIVNLPMPNERVGLIIGKGGMTIKSLQEKTNCQVYIPPGPDEDNPAVRTLTIGSNYEQCLEAIQKEIFNLVQASQSTISSSGTSTISMTVPDDKIGLVIGKGGFNIKDIQARTNCKVVIPQSADAGSNPPVRTIQIIGTPENQTQCRYEIELIVSGQSNPLKTASLNSSSTSYYAPQTQYDYSAYSSYASYYNTGSSASTTPAASSTAAASTAAVAPIDPTMYYNDFWNYASYYGEKAARLYYDAWSPPEGTPPPEGIVVATEEEAAKNLEKYASSSK